MSWLFNKKCHKDTREDVYKAMKRLATFAVKGHDEREQRVARLFNELYKFIESLVEIDSKGHHHIATRLFKFSHIESDTIYWILEIAKTFYMCCRIKDEPGNFPRRKMCGRFFILCRLYSSTLK